VDEIFALKLVPWIGLKSCLVNYLVVKCCMFLFSCYLCKWHANGMQSARSFLTGIWSF
jgi:hypothetical protein